MLYKYEHFFLITSNVTINWLPLFYTHTIPERLTPQPDKIRQQGNFGKQPVWIKSSFIRHCCFNNDLWYVRGVVGSQSFSPPPLRNFNVFRPLYKPRVQCKLPQVIFLLSSPTWIRHTYLWDLKKCGINFLKQQIV